MPSNYISTLGSAFKKKIQRSVIGKEGDLKASLGVFIGQEKLGTLVKPGPLVAAQSNLHLVDKKRNITVVEVFSRSFSIPSVSGPSFQICGYHSDRLISQPRNSLCGIEFQKTPMGTVIGDRSLNSLTSKIGNIKVAPNNAAVLRSRSRVSFDCCGKANMSLAIKEQNNNLFLYRYFIYNVTNRRGGSLPHTDLGLKCYHSSSPATSSAGTASDVPFENSGSEEQLSNATVSTERKDIAERTLKLVSGSCYLPHPDKEETGGEDAHFICTDEQAIGVADGVGGWADLGINAGLFARELMSNSVAAIHEEPKGSIDPARVLEKAHSSTKSRGSSTACIVALTKQGINAINLGDSGFIVVRDGVTVFRSPVQQHDFNFTYQLESGNGGDLPSSGQVFTVPVAPGDVIIAGTDGLFDNLYNNEVTGVVVHAKRAGLGPQVTAQKIAALARQRALDKNRQTPFSTAAQDAGIRYYGGKLDDITVVVSYVTSSSNESQPSSTSAPG